MAWMPDRGSIQTRATQDPTRVCLRGRRRVSGICLDTSDEEPSVRSVTGRHVVRRVGEPEQSFASRDWILLTRRRCNPQHVATRAPTIFLQQSQVLLQMLRFLPMVKIRVWLVLQGHGQFFTVPLGSMCEVRSVDRENSCWGEVEDLTSKENVVGVVAMSGGSSSDPN